ncbi:glycosyltransferase family 4 protein [Roseomonas alkaliterrae]|uniref:Glycosyltransferase involved in cell wall biosynthesis n=1 Tax=Neoroseomonas alkaliterrae TaxID=1452450 RepID=A0A840YBK4_9PROT|nr:glycosyltransferase family 4 protein [Neoroseomonas alkaliterrae]MBB5691932.1 glycosyltransferase involved in cell wall biosynthesis [Neoroseomonas alkaliterrae]MBR0677091.1 glycosyltransferase family 4 protein [Neoroseomonas alkaliterrae]
MKVLLVSNLFPPEVLGGYELLAAEVATMLARQGHAVTVATTPLVNRVDTQVDPRLSIRRSLEFNANWLSPDPPSDAAEFRGGFLSMRNIAALRLLLEETEPDRVVLFNTDGLGTLGLIAFLHACGHRPVHYMADNVFRFLDSRQAAETFRSFARVFRLEPALKALSVLAMSRTVYDEAAHSLGTAPGTVAFVPGTVPDKLPPLVPRSDPEGTLRLVFSSRIAPHKGTLLMLDALRLLLDRGERGFTVDVFGNGGVPDLLQRAHAHGLGPHLRFAGGIGREAMIQRFADYDALLFPTWMREPFGLVAAEAAAQGCIPIVTAQTGVAEWLMTGDAIKIERSVEGLAGGIQRLLYLPPAEREAQRRRTSDAARRLFAADRWYPRIERAILDAASCSRAPSARDVEDAFFAMARIWRG